MLNKSYYKSGVEAANTKMRSGCNMHPAVFSLGSCQVLYICLILLISVLLLYGFMQFTEVNDACEVFATEAEFPAGGSTEMQEDSWNCCNQWQGSAIHIKQKSDASPKNCLNCLLCTIPKVITLVCPG